MKITAKIYYYMMEEDQHQNESPIVEEREDMLPPLKRVKRSAALKSENTWKNIIYDNDSVPVSDSTNESSRKKNKVDDKITKKDVEQKQSNVSVAKSTRRKSTKTKGRQKKSEELPIVSVNDTNRELPISNNNGGVNINFQEKLTSTSDKFVPIESLNALDNKISTPVKRKSRGVTSKTPKVPSVVVVKPQSKNKDICSDVNLDSGRNKTFNITPDMKHNLSSPLNNRHIITVTNSNFSVINTTQSNISNYALKNRISQIINKHGTKILNGQSLYEANKVLDEMCSTIEHLIEENKANIANAEKMEKNFKTTIQLKDTKISKLIQRVNTLEAEIVRINRRKQLNVLENLSMYNNVGNEVGENNVSVNTPVINNEYTISSLHGNSQGISNSISDFNSSYNMNDSLLADGHMINNNNDNFVISKPPQRHGSRLSGQDLPYFNSTGPSYQGNTYNNVYGMNSLEIERDIIPLSTTSFAVNNVQQVIPSERSVVEKNGVTYQDL